jgi:S-adenosylmethionine decarboxylase
MEGTCCMNAFEHFICVDHEIYVGNHLIADLWGVTNHTCEEDIVESFTKACEDAGATVLFKHCHSFGPGCGTTGVIVLSESHCSWHAYPEVNMIAVDIFMCGTASPQKAMPRITDFWKPQSIDIKTIKRGQVLTHKLPDHLIPTIA